MQVLDAGEINIFENDKGYLVIPFKMHIKINKHQMIQTFLCMLSGPKQV
jgi:hypothetical protein